MKLKRHYDEDGAIAYLEAQTIGELGETQHFSPRILERGMAEGWLSIADGELKIKTAPGKPDIRFAIREAPGIFCSHCGERMSSSPDAQAHVAEAHAGADSPDESNPAGYRVDNFHRTERIA